MLQAYYAQGLVIVNHAFIYQKGPLLIGLFYYALGLINLKYLGQLLNFMGFALRQVNIKKRLLVIEFHAIFHMVFHNQRSVLSWFHLSNISYFTFQGLVIVSFTYFTWADQSIFIFGLDFKRVVYSAGPSGFTCIIMGFSLRQVNIKKRVVISYFKGQLLLISHQSPWAR